VAEFADQAEVRVRAGDGGHGCASIHREKFKPLGGPNGGNGGRGGDVIIEVDPGVTTLLDFHRRSVRRAGNGTPGAGNNRAGAEGDDLVLRVPDGTVIKTGDGRQLADLTGAGTRYVAGTGGRGGLGNAALASTRRKAPGFALRGGPRRAARSRAPCAGSRPARRARRRVGPGPGAEDRRGRGPGRLPQRREVLAHRRHVGRPAQDRQLPLHHPDPAPGRG
jgi:hypothetical protein